LRRIAGEGTQAQLTPLGSGFFVAPNVFLTCNHVINDPRNPHQAGDGYQIVRNFGAQGDFCRMMDVQVDKDISLIPSADAAIFRVPGDTRPFVTVDYSDVSEGESIGVAGYPLGMVTADGNGQPKYEGLIFRVAKGTIGAIYSQVLQGPYVPVTKALSNIEVNFMFVSGNSGGPIFHAETGRVLAFVHGVMDKCIVQRVADTASANVALGVPSKHVESIFAIYSVGIRLANIRTELEGFGVTL